MLISDVIHIKFKLRSPMYYHNFEPNMSYANHTTNYELMDTCYLPPLLTSEVLQKKKVKT